MKRSETKSAEAVSPDETVSEMGELNRREFLKWLSLSGTSVLMLSAGEAWPVTAQVPSPCKDSDNMIGGIRMFAFGGTPSACLKPCNGQLVPLAENVMLFVVTDKTFGGNGTTNFAAPDFRRTAPKGAAPGDSASGKRTILAVDTGAAEDDSQANYLVINFCITTQGPFPARYTDEKRK